MLEQLDPVLGPSFKELAVLGDGSPVVVLGVEVGWTVTAEQKRVVY